MLITFQIILFALILLFSLYLLAAEGQFSKETKGMFTSVLIASIIAETICFVIR